MDHSNPRLRIALAVVGALIIATLLTVVVLMFSAGGGQGAIVTETTSVGVLPSATSPSSSTAPAATAISSTTAPPTSVPPTTTTTTPTTSTTLGASTTTTTEPAIDPSTFDTATKTGTASGSPGSNLTGLRTGDHENFVRIVFDFDGDGTPAYEVGYQAGPTFTGSGGGEPVGPAGSAFLVIRVTPGLIHDANSGSLTYAGELTFDPGLEPIDEIAFVGDFEADLMWVIGLDAQHGFDVSTRLEPQRLVIDIAR